MTVLGPGTITFGDTDYSAIWIGGTLNTNVNAKDGKKFLDASSSGGGRAYTHELAGKIAQDIEDPAGLVRLAWEQAGSEIEFVYTPNTAAGCIVTGTVVIDPLTIGGDAFGEELESDIKWGVVGKPTIEWPAPPGKNSAESAAEVVAQVEVRKPRK